MINSLIQFFLHERLLVLASCVLFIVYGWDSTKKIPIDAIPDIGENQVIVLTDWSGRSPKDIEDQITYPLSIALQAVPGSTSVRGKSMFGFSFIQITFGDEIDFYWARSRVSEQLSTVTSQLPEGVSPRLAPDATGLGQIYYYVLEPPVGMNLAELRSKQDFFIKYALQSVEGVAEVASIGGYVKQYQVEVDPEKLQFHNIPLNAVIKAVKDSNIDVGAKTVESGGMAFIVRGKGFIGSGKTEEETIRQIEKTVVVTRDRIPIRLRDLAQVQIGPAFRDGALDYNGHEAVGGIVVMRYRENPRAVIKRVEEKIKSLEPDLHGIKIKAIYNRTTLIDETVGTLTKALTHETLITIMVIVLFLLNVRASLVIAITLPMAVLMSFIAMRLFSVDANIMSLAGIAIAIGTMVDMGIIVLENVYGGLADWKEDGSPGGERHRLKVICDSASEVIPAVITAVSTTVVSFLPVFFLTGRDHKLFAPLAWTKTFALISSLIVAVAVVPLLCRIFLHEGNRSRLQGTLIGLGMATLFASLSYFVWGESIAKTTEMSPLIVALLVGCVSFGIGYWVSREKIRSMEKNPSSQVLQWIYGARLEFALRRKMLMLSFPFMILILGVVAWLGLPTVLRPVEKVASFFGADLNNLPGYVTAKHTYKGLKSDDWIALDEGAWFYMPSLLPAASFNQSLEILQTQDAMILQIPEIQDVLGKIGRAQSALDPAPTGMIETYVMLKPRVEWRPGMTERMIWDEINKVAKIPGIPLASPLQPVKGRVVMLQSGIKASMAIRIYGDSLTGLGKAAEAVAEQLKKHPLVNTKTVNPDVVMGKPYFEFEIDREEAARYGMTTRMVNQIVAAGLGGLDVTTTVEGRERYPIQIRFNREVREKIETLGKIPIVTSTQEVVPLERLTYSSTTWGPSAINSENSRLVAHVIFAPKKGVGDLEVIESVMAFLANASENKELVMPEGNFELEPVGSFQNQIEANERLLWLVPMVLLINFLLHYIHFRNISIALVVFTGIPVSFAGGMIAVAVMGVEINTAVWIGFIALFGLAADDGIVIASYIQHSLAQKKIGSVSELRNAIYKAGLKRIRPCMMTTVTTLFALIPVLISTGRGADVARAMAIPVFGGMLIEPFTSFIVPTLYCAYLELKIKLGLHDDLLEMCETKNKTKPLL